MWAVLHPSHPSSTIPPTLSSLAGPLVSNGFPGGPDSVGGVLELPDWALLWDGSATVRHGMGG